MKVWRKQSNSYVNALVFLKIIRFFMSLLRIKRGNPEGRGRRRAMRRAGGMMERKTTEKQCLYSRKEGEEMKSRWRQSPCPNSLLHLSTPPGKEPVLTLSFRTQKAARSAN